MAITKTFERNNPEVFRFACLAGHGQKQEDVTICPRCHNKVYPKHTGCPDYQIDWKAPMGTLSLRVEAKACRPDKSDPNGGRFDFAQIKQEQHGWMGDWLNCLSSPLEQGYVWIQMGAHAVNAKSEYKRQIFLVSYSVYLETEWTLKNVGVNNLPLTAELANTRIATRDNQLFAKNIWSKWALTYHGDRYWWPGETHPIFNLLKTPYYSFEEAKRIHGSRPHPE